MRRAPGKGLAGDREGKRGREGWRQEEKDETEMGRKQAVHEAGCAQQHEFEWLLQLVLIVAGQFTLPGSQAGAGRAGGCTCCEWGSNSRTCPVLVPTASVVHQ